LWHSLKKNGDINFYDVRWPDGVIETNIPTITLEKVRDSEDLGESHKSHTTEGYEEGSAVSERKYKKKKTKKPKKKKSKRNKHKLYPYYEPGIEVDFGGDFNGGGVE
jgi:hypothetical protein